jgi:UDP-glucose 4-epimerase
MLNNESIRSVLVTGGCGYIGTHTVVNLLENGFMPIVIDDLSSGHIEAINLINEHYPFNPELTIKKLNHKSAAFYKGDFSDIKLIEKIVKEHNIKGVIHFAAHSLVGQSMEKPLKYYENNISKSIALLKFLKEFGIKIFIFSSSAAVYGNSQNIPIEENSALNPINPYGFSKFAIERVLEDMNAAYGFKYVSLRYFNAAGAHPSGIIGEDHNPETHLVPNVLKSIVKGENKAFVYGKDYPTDDGTAIRDYIHVCDLASAHTLSLKYLFENRSGNSKIYNLGCETGYSVIEILKKIESITGNLLNIEFTNRRKGDPAVLVASSKKIQKELGFKFKYSIDDIISSAWKWHFNNKNGFSKNLK